LAAQPHLHSKNYISLTKIDLDISCNWDCLLWSWILLEALSQKYYDYDCEHQYQHI